MAKNIKYVTAVGEAIYPHLIIPDTKFSTDGIYHVKLKLPADSEVTTANGEHKGTIETLLSEKIEASIEKAKEKTNKKKVKEALPPFELEDGFITVGFKLKARVTNKSGEFFEQRPALFDSKQQPFNEDFIGSGSKLKIAFEVIDYYTAMIGAGITLRLKAVQVIELSKGNGQSASAFGFGEEEGFVSEAVKEESVSGTDADNRAVTLEDAESGDF